MPSYTTVSLYFPFEGAGSEWILLPVADLSSVQPI